MCVHPFISGSAWIWSTGGEVLRADEGGAEQRGVAVAEQLGKSCQVNLENRDGPSDSRSDFRCFCSSPKWPLVLFLFFTGARHQHFKFGWRCPGPSEPASFARESFRGLVPSRRRPERIAAPLNDHHRGEARGPRAPHPQGRLGAAAGRGPLPQRGQRANIGSARGEDAGDP